MNITLRNVCFIISLLLLSHVASAQKMMHLDKSTDKWPDYYFFRGGLLYTMPEFITLVPEDRQSLGIRGSAGFMNFLTPKWSIGAEAGIGYYGKVRNVNIAVDNISPTNDFSYYGFDGAGVIAYQISQALAIRGRLGVELMVSQALYNKRVYFDYFRPNTYNTGTLFGAGLTYQVTDRLFLTGDYSFINGLFFVNNNILGINQPQFNSFQFGIEYRC